MMRSLALLLQIICLIEAHHPPSNRELRNLSDSAKEFTSDITMEMGMHMAGSVFGIPPSRKVFIDFIYNATAKYLCLDNADQKSLYNAYFYMQPKKGPIKDKLMNISDCDMALIRESMSKFYILTNLTQAVDYIKSKNLPLGKKIEELIRNTKKQYHQLTEPAKHFSKEELYLTVAQRNFPATSTLSVVEQEQLANKIIRKYKALPFETRVEVLRGYTWYYAEEMLNSVYDIMFTSNNKESIFPF